MDADKEPVLDAEIVETVETTPAVADPAPVELPPSDYSESGVPSFDYVRDRIENRVATSIGAEELSGATPEGKAVEDQFEARQKAGLSRLEEIRKSMRGE